MVFVFFSSMVWIVIKLSKDFTSTVTYRVEYQNIPAGKILVSASDSTITVGLDARGFDLIKYHFFKKRPVADIDLTGMRLWPDGNTFSGALLTSGLTRKLATQLGSHNELIFITPDTLKFVFMAEHSRKVPVVPQVQYQLRAQHMLYDSLQVVPDSIWIYGPGDLIDTILHVKTEQRTFTDLQENQHTILLLQKPANLPLSYSENEVNVNLRVEKFTEKSIELPIMIHCPDSEYTLRIFPETAKVHCLVALKDYKRIDPAMFEAAVVCKPDDMQLSAKLKVEVTQHPAYVRIARIEPERVEYILVKPTK